MVLLSPCKINIGLYVTSLRNDGYHNIESIFYPIPLYDVVEVIIADQLQMTTTGIAIPSTPKGNICEQAYALLKKDYTAIPNVHIHLHKCNPIGAGLGGGSANGTAVLKLLNAVCNLQLSDAAMLQYAAVLGSDCAFFVHNTACHVTGRGEVLTPITLDLSAYTILLVHPNIHIATATAFGGIVPQQPLYNLLQSIQQPVHNWRGSIHNQFEHNALSTHTILSTIKDAMYHTGALYASMSGSGSSIYGIYAKGSITHNTISPALSKYSYHII